MCDSQLQYVLVFDHAIRIGLNVFECAGPFHSPAEAQSWYSGNIKVPTCGCVLQTIWNVIEPH